ncbi:hypothetical protein HDU84_004661 [Entophlyctis sp. JEL0112]|nr:hypothetical protein HDU84_004661 [Entophlyctis sp. JEL0112]
MAEAAVPRVDAGNGDDGATLVDAIARLATEAQRSPAVELGSTRAWADAAGATARLHGGPVALVHTACAHPLLQLSEQSPKAGTRSRAPAAATAAVQRRMFKAVAAILASLCASGPTHHPVRPNLPFAAVAAPKRKRGEAKALAAANFKRTSAAPLVHNAADLHCAIASVMRNASVSPLSVHLLLPFTPAFDTAAPGFHSLIISRLCTDLSYASEVWQILQPPFYSFPLVSELPTSESDVYPQHIVNAVSFLVKTGTNAVIAVMRDSPQLRSLVFSGIDSQWHEVLASTAENIANSATSSTENMSTEDEANRGAEFRNILLEAKQVTRIRHKCYELVVSAQASDSRLVQSHPPAHEAIVTAGRLSTLGWLVREVARFLHSADSDSTTNSDGVYAEDLRFVEGPVPLLGGMLAEIPQPHAMLAAHVAITQLARAMSRVYAGPGAADGGDKELLSLFYGAVAAVLRPIGFAGRSEGEWAWVDTVCATAINVAMRKDDLRQVHHQQLSHQQPLGPPQVEHLESDQRVDGEDANRPDDDDDDHVMDESAAIERYTGGSAIVFVADEPTFREFETATCDSGSFNCVAFDCEWRPDSWKLFGERDSPAATLQIAIGLLRSDGEVNTRIFQNVKVFVLGLAEISEADMVRVVGRLFLDKVILKLGFGFAEDTSRLRRRYPSFPAEMRNYYDLSTVTTAMRSKQYFQAKKKISLADMVLQYLGVSLDKRVRMSDWEIRPLTQRMLTYAGNDAKVLLDLYQQMLREGDLGKAKGDTGKKKKGQQK